MTDTAGKRKRQRKSAKRANKPRKPAKKAKDPQQGTLKATEVQGQAVAAPPKKASRGAAAVPYAAAWDHFVGYLRGHVATKGIFFANNDALLGYLRQQDPVPELDDVKFWATYYHLYATTVPSFFASRTSYSDRDDTGESNEDEEQRPTFHWDDCGDEDGLLSPEDRAIADQLQPQTSDAQCRSLTCILMHERMLAFVSEAEELAAPQPGTKRRYHRILSHNAEAKSWYPVFRTQQSWLSHEQLQTALAHIWWPTRVVKGARETRHIVQLSRHIMLLGIHLKGLASLSARLADPVLKPTVFTHPFLQINPVSKKEATAASILAWLAAGGHQSCSACGGCHVGANNDQTAMRTIKCHRKVLKVEYCWICGCSLHPSTASDHFAACKASFLKGRSLDTNQSRRYHGPGPGAHHSMLIVFCPFAVCHSADRDKHGNTGMDAALAGTDYRRSHPVKNKVSGYDDSVKSLAA